MRHGAIELKDCVRFRRLPYELMAVIYAVLQAAEEQSITPVITGASYEDYPAGGYHNLGYAWDVRTRGVPDPRRYADSIGRFLRAVHPLYLVRYGDATHLDHIHIAYQYNRPREAEKESE